MSRAEDQGDGVESRLLAEDQGREDQALEGLHERRRRATTARAREMEPWKSMRTRVTAGMAERTTPRKGITLRKPDGESDEEGELHAAEPEADRREQALDDADEEAPPEEGGDGHVDLAHDGEDARPVPSRQVAT